MYETPDSYNKPIRLKTDKTLKYQYFCDKEHPLANSQGRIYYHRHVASLKLNRWVKKSEDVHHIDENRQNNTPENLEILDKSDHRRLHIFEHLVAEPLENKICIECNNIFKPIHKIQKFCSRICNELDRRLFNPSKEELEKLVWEKSTIEVAKLFNVTDKAIEKRCKKLGIKKPPRGYWAKKYAERIHKPS